MNVEDIIKLFDNCIFEYHDREALEDRSDNHYAPGTLENFLFEKSWTDNIQWHLEDLIRDPKIDPGAALQLKRKIDHYNQRRTDIVEKIDDWFFEKFKDVKPLPGAGLNTETPAWAIDRLSILALKIWHMGIEAERGDASDEHREKCRQKFYVLLSQRDDLSTAIQQLLEDIAAGRKKLKLYRQMKMYNDEELNPILYQQKNKQ